MRFSCPKCWDNPCTCGHEQREADKLRAEVARDFPPPGIVERYRPGPRTRAAVSMALDIGATAAQAYLKTQGYQGLRTAAAIRALPTPMPFQADPTADVSTFARGRLCRGRSQQLHAVRLARRHGPPGAGVMERAPEGVVFRWRPMIAPAETYLGLPCRRGHLRRYRTSRECVACKLAQVKARRKAQPPRKPRKLNADLGKSVRAWAGIARVRGMQAHVATIVGVRHSTVAKWTVVPLDYVFVLSKVLHVPPEDLRPDFFCNDPLRRSAFAKLVVAPKLVPEAVSIS